MNGDMRWYDVLQLLWQLHCASSDLCMRQSLLNVNNEAGDMGQMHTLLRKGISFGRTGKACDAVMQWSNAVQCRYAVMRCMMRCSYAMQSCDAVVRCTEEAVMKCNNTVIVCNDKMHCAVQWSDELTMFSDANNWGYVRCNDDML